MINGAPENIIWCYGMYQPAYDEMLKTIPNITFVKGVPGDLESMINPSLRNLVVIDDLMQELSNNQRITNLFTKDVTIAISALFLFSKTFFTAEKNKEI